MTGIYVFIGIVSGLLLLDIGTLIRIYSDKDEDNK